MRELLKEAEVEAGVERVWAAWTTSEGAKSFFAPEANVKLALGGPYEMLFDLDQPPGLRGGEGCRVLAFLPNELLAFEWNAPPHFPAERGQHTFVVVQLHSAAPGRTRVRLRHLGWGEGGKWDEVYAYFERAWGIVLRRLAHRFAVGPVDWAAPPG